MAKKLDKAITRYGWSGQHRIDFEVEEQQNGTFQIRQAITIFKGACEPVTEVDFYLADNGQDLTDTLAKLIEEFRNRFMPRGIDILA